MVMQIENINSERIKIELTKAHRGGPWSTSFSGRPEGEAVRKQLKIDKLDKDNKLYEFTMPEDTTTFNPSFYLGLLFASIKVLGMEKFKQKYVIAIDNLLEESKRTITEDIKYALQRATMDLQGCSPFEGYF